VSSRITPKSVFRHHADEERVVERVDHAEGDLREVALGLDDRRQERDLEDQPDDEKWHGDRDVPRAGRFAPWRPERAATEADGDDDDADDLEERRDPLERLDVHPDADREEEPAEEQQVRLREAGAAPRAAA
jgi:hypothetical protein